MRSINHWLIGHKVAKMHREQPKPTEIPRHDTLAMVLSCLVLFFCGCRHHPQPPDTGKTSFAFVEPPPAKSSHSDRSGAVDEPLVEEHFIEAEPIRPLATPVYPSKALAAKAGLVTIGVKVTIDVDGRVSDVSPSMLTFSPPTRYADDFQEAVRLAVMKWRFHQAQHYSLQVFRANEGVAARKNSTGKIRKPISTWPSPFRPPGSCIIGLVDKIAQVWLDQREGARFSEGSMQKIRSLFPPGWRGLFFSKTYSDADFQALIERGRPTLRAGDGFPSQENVFRALEQFES